MYLYKILFLFLFTVLTISPLAAQSKDFPATQFGKIIQDWLTLINNASETEMKAFVENNFSKEAIRLQSVNETVFVMQKLKIQSGGLEILSVIPSRGEFPNMINVKSKNHHI